MKKILLFVFASLFIAPLFVFASCIGDSYETDVTTSNGSVVSECKCASGSSGTYPDCKCPSGTVLSGSSCVTASSTTGASTRAAMEADQCLSAKCSSSTTMSSTVAPTYNYTTGACSCPSGYSSAEVDSFNESRGITSGSNNNSTGNVTGTNNSAGSTGLTSSTGGISNPITASSFAELVDMVVAWILNIAMVLAPLIIVYGGFTYITAAGDTSKIGQAKKIILYAVIGFILALLAKSLVDIFKTFGS
jgi:hypothetical protein